VVVGMPRRMIEEVEEGSGGVLSVRRWRSWYSSPGV
jgi:hypothetical protein